MSYRFGLQPLTVAGATLAAGTNCQITIATGITTPAAAEAADQTDMTYAVSVGTTIAATAIPTSTAITTGLGSTAWTVTPATYATQTVASFAFTPVGDVA